MATPTIVYCYVDDSVSGRTEDRTIEAAEARTKAHGGGTVTVMTERPDGKAVPGTRTRQRRSRTSGHGCGTGARSGRTQERGTATVRAGGAGAVKVPAVAAAFWLVKILTTGMGETASDFLARVLGPGVAGGLGAVGLVVLLGCQISASRYRAALYWAAIATVSVFGTMAADVVHVVVGVPYAVSTVVFAVLLSAVLLAWYGSEGTLSIHTVRTRRRECFYWATVLLTFALGTAAGDLTAGTLHLGYLPAGVLFAALIAVPPLAYRFLGLNAVAAFWWAYILTRPLGASFADWMGVGADRGGLGWGTGHVSLALAVPIAVLVGWLALSGADAPVRETPPGAHVPEAAPAGRARQAGLGARPENAFDRR